MTEKLTIECQKCGKEGILRIPSNVGGNVSVRCPGCGTVFEQHVDRRYSLRRIPLPWVAYGPASSEDLPYMGWLSDISMNGCRLRTEKQTPIKGAWLNLEFRLEIDCSEVPEKERKAILGIESDHMDQLLHPLIRVRAKTIWTKRAGKNSLEFGVEFISIGDHARKMLTLYLYPHHEAL